MMGEVASRIAALEAAILRVESDVAGCVNELLIDDGRYLVAERLPRFGTAILSRVHELLADPSVEIEVRVLGALAGLAVGDQGPSVVELMEEIERRGELAPLAARALARHKVPGAGHAALIGLRSTDTADVDSVVMFLEAMRESNSDLPVADRDRLEMTSDWRVRSAIREIFPTGDPDS